MLFEQSLDVAARDEVVARQWRIAGLSFPPARTRLIVARGFRHDRQFAQALADRKDNVTLGDGDSRRALVINTVAEFIRFVVFVDSRRTADANHVTAFPAGLD